MTADGFGTHGTSSHSLTEGTRSSRTSLAPSDFVSVLYPEYSGALALAAHQIQTAVAPLPFHTDRIGFLRATSRVVLYGVDGRLYTVPVEFAPAIQGHSTHFDFVDVLHNVSTVDVTAAYVCPANKARARLGSVRVGLGVFTYHDLVTGATRHVAFTGGESCTELTRLVRLLGYKVIEHGSYEIVGLTLTPGAYGNPERVLVTVTDTLPPYQKPAQLELPFED